MDKKLWKSKTLWVNLVAGIGLILQAVTGNVVLDPELQTAIIVVVNFLLRLITNQGLTP